MATVMGGGELHAAIRALSYRLKATTLQAFNGAMSRQKVFGEACQSHQRAPVYSPSAWMPRVRVCC
ncbi:hypothetical protein Tcan_06399 [Toxocara canis]|uniref:Uncharacterized protein n=1 Tax=Toxocara canis TaxID=6265 RepID=A0A0B2VQP1_TOXCA|nr:hypothetical protein Tcan_06399 [Toxocara canis]